MTPRRIVIVGGGVTGLTAAYRLLANAREGKGERGPIEVTVLEERDRLGGNISTERRDGFVIEAGPDSFVATKPHAAALCRELGLGDQLISTVARNRKVYIRHEGALHALPEGMVLGIPTRALPVVKTPILSWPAKARLALDLVLPRRAVGDDESIGHFIRRRLGHEASERIAEPLLGGIFTGDVDALSIRATFPQIVAMEEQHGSLIRGAIAMRAARGGTAKGPAPSAFLSLLGGMGEMISALAASIKESGGVLRLGVKVEAIERSSTPGVPTRDGAEPPARFRVDVIDPVGTRASIPADDVLIATPAYRAADALAHLDADLAAALRAIPYESSATVALAYPRREVPHPLDATGVIIPKGERRRILAATFISSKWDGRAPPDTALLRVFVGGGRDPGALERPDADLIELARSELGELIGVRAEPLLARVFRYDRGSAQPTLGHADRMRRVRARAALHEGLHLAGAAFEGVGIPDCVRQANEVAARILAAPRHANAAPS